MSAYIHVDSQLLVRRETAAVRCTPESTHARLLLRVLANAVTAHGVLKQDGDELTGNPLVQVVALREKADGPRPPAVQEAGSGSVEWKGGQNWGHDDAGVDTTHPGQNEKGDGVPTRLVSAQNINW